MKEVLQDRKKFYNKLLEFRVIFWNQKFRHDRIGEGFVTEEKKMKVLEFDQRRNIKSTL